MTVDGLDITTATGASPQVRDDFGGTSSATPLTAAVAGLVISANLDLSALEVASILRRTASKDLNMAGYPRTPGTAYDPNTNWDISPIAPFDTGDFQDSGHSDGTWSPWFGHGKVDALAAVQAAMGDVALQTGKVRIELSPDLAIPDLDPAGVTSSVSVQDTGTIQSLQVHVDIEHTYIGDLIVRLVGPNGARVNLHLREGRSTDNLERTFHLDSTPALSAFLGSELGGRWALEVSDHARRDVGRLRRWSLEAEVQRKTGGEFESSPGTLIPDDAPDGIEDRISVSNIGTLRDIRIDLDVSHTYIGDLIVTLTSPAGSEVVLHQFEGRWADDIRQSYDTVNEPELAGLVGENANGEWALRIEDHAPRDTGKLNGWTLHLEGDD
jgi:subtilisin-like proprotein convertase family protein